MRELVKDMDLESGCCRVLWLIPFDQRCSLLGPGGRAVHKIKAEAGLHTLLLTRDVETETYFGEIYTQVHLAGRPESTRHALAAINAIVGGRLAEDGFEELLHASQAALRVSSGGLTFQCLTELPEIRDAMVHTRLLRQGVGLRTLLEVLGQWPEYFSVQRTGPQGATVAAVVKPSYMHNKEVDGGAGDKNGGRR